MSESGGKLGNYIREVVGDGSTRDAIERRGIQVIKNESLEANRLMKERLGVLRGISETSIDNLLTNFSQSGGEIKNNYQKLLDTVPKEVSHIPDNPQLASFLAVDVKKTAPTIKSEILATYEKESIPHTFITIMNSYEESLGIPSQAAARLTLRYLDASRIELSKTVADLKQNEQLSDEEATRKAIYLLGESRAKHIDEIRRMMQERNLDPLKAHAQVLLGHVKGTNTPETIPSLSISASDKAGLIEAYHIQDRPYTEDELRLTQRILTEDPEVRTTLVAFHKTFLDYFSDYFKQHPDRMQQNLEPFNPIFVPVRDADGTITSLAPNPKLIKTMIQNWLPAVARELQKDQGGIAIDTIDVSALTAEHLERGIAAAEDYSIFSSTLAVFKKIDGTDSMSWESVFPAMCPAKKSITEGGKTILPIIYRFRKTFESRSKDDTVVASAA